LNPLPARRFRLAAPMEGRRHSLGVTRWGPGRELPGAAPQPGLRAVHGGTGSGLRRAIGMTERLRCGHP
jgi:hypothetical protein